MSAIVSYVRVDKQEKEGRHMILSRKVDERGKREGVYVE